MSPPRAQQAVDEAWMGEALTEAARADFWTSPNPMVGAVILDAGGREVARAHHRRAGEPHAEAAALSAAGERARGGTVVVTLEPCGHVGRTPPCVDAVIAAGPARVVVAMLDPDPRMNGRSLALLRSAGIVVVEGVLADRARRLNAFHLHWKRTGRPFVTAKFASSLDGRIATRLGESRWITSPPARRHAHVLRHQHDGVGVGVGTIVADDPLLTTRLLPSPGRQPVRVVVDSRLRIPMAARVLGGTGAVVATTGAAPPEAVNRLREAGVDVAVLAARTDGRVDIGALLDHLGGRDIISLLIEGGAGLLGSAFDDEVVQRVVAVLAPRVIGGAGAVGAVGGRGVGVLAEAVVMNEVTVERMGGDIVVTADMP